ncbi:MAG: AhpC/TSA family protein [Sphingobacteriaceae bacterium]|nr:MAG: AhpC/TSA family protein [Sphingobacteriaceae bacterium]
MHKISIAAFLLFISFTSAFAKGYKLSGEVQGVKDSSWLYLQIGNRVDSAMVLNGKFQFKGTLSSKAESVVLFTWHYTDYVYFWLENKPMRMKVKDGEFKKGIIKGSRIQDENYAMQVSKYSITNETDSLFKLIRTEKDKDIQASISKRLNELRDMDIAFDKNYVKTHPKSFISAYILSVYATTWGKGTAVELYKNFSPELKRTAYGTNISNYIALNKNVKQGDKFADFEQTNTKGQRVKLSDIKTNYVLLDFWASWCGPCRQENPSVVKAYNLYKDKGFTILSVSLDENKTQWLKAIEKDGLVWEHVSDLKGFNNNAALIYGINGIPDNFLIDKNGIIIARNLRGEGLEKKLKELMP